MVILSVKSKNVKIDEKQEFGAHFEQASGY